MHIEQARPNPEKAAKTQESDYGFGYLSLFGM